MNIILALNNFSHISNIKSSPSSLRTQKWINLSLNWLIPEWDRVIFLWASAANGRSISNYPINVFDWWWWHVIFSNVCVLFFRERLNPSCLLSELEFSMVMKSVIGLELVPLFMCCQNLLIDLLGFSKFDGIGFLSFSFDLGQSVRKHLLLLVEFWKFDFASSLLVWWGWHWVSHWRCWILLSWKVDWNVELLFIVWLRKRSS